jgi:hypothetical protein
MHRHRSSSSYSSRDVRPFDRDEIDMIECANRHSNGPVVLQWDRNVRNVRNVRKRNKGERFVRVELVSNFFMIPSNDSPL